MPLCRRKRVLLTDHPKDIDPNKEVFLLERTGEIFETYESGLLKSTIHENTTWSASTARCAYAARLSFYRLKQFQCEVTGKSNLDYFQALESERIEAKTLQDRFPEPLKIAVLRAVQWQIIGRLDHLVEAVYDRFKDRYYEGERVFVDVGGERFHSIIRKVFPPKKQSAKARAGSPSSSTSDSETDEPDTPLPPHTIGGNLSIPAEEVAARDDAKQYQYRVEILDEPTAGDPPTVVAAKAKYAGNYTNASRDQLSRDRLAFSKSILRRFIRESVDRAPALASPWTIKPAVAKRYGLEQEMSEVVRERIEASRLGAVEKRRKMWEDKQPPEEERPKKKQRKNAEQQLAPEKVEPEKKAPKKPIKYPIEDLDVRLTEREKKHGSLLCRPLPSRSLPFGNSWEFEKFLMSWNFLNTFSQPLRLSPFTMDDYEQALRHTSLQHPCFLLAELHTTLIMLMRTIPFNKHSTVLGLLAAKERGDDWDGGQESAVSVDDVVGALADVGNSWERIPLRQSSIRAGWEEALVGCIKDHASPANFPRLRIILTKLLFAPSDMSVEDDDNPRSSPVLQHDLEDLTEPASPSVRYYALPPADRITIIAFLCDLAISSRSIHAHMESCDEALTALRKEKIEANKEKRRLQEEVALLSEKDKPVGEKAEGETGTDSPAPAAPSEEVEPSIASLSDIEVDSETGAPMSDGVSDSGRDYVPATNGTARQRTLRIKLQSKAHSKQREVARAKEAEAKQTAAQIKKLDEEINKTDRNLERIEREFRKLLGVARLKPLGRDRFYNRVWWFDGVGGTSLVSSQGSVLYGSGRLFLQGPSEFDIEMLDQRDEKELESRRAEEEPGLVLGVGEWAVYEDYEQIEYFFNWLNPKGHRELALRNGLTKWWELLIPSMRKRSADQANNIKAPDARRSSRKTSSKDLTREPYMLWTNRRAPTTAS